MMEIYWRVFVSLPKVLWYKIKYAGKCTLPWIQAFGHHTELKIKNGKASFGKEQITRGNAVFRVEGGELMAFGSANPRTEERYDSGSFTTYYGRSMAVIRTGHAGKVKITAKGGETATAEITIK